MRSGSVRGLTGSRQFAHTLGQYRFPPEATSSRLPAAYRPPGFLIILVKSSDGMPPPVLRLEYRLPTSRVVASAE